MSIPADSADRPAFRFPTPAERMDSTGERYVSGLIGDVQSEHYHRYLFALRYCVDRAVLDVASGEGYGSALLAQVARSVTGLDVDAASVAFANAQYGSPRVAFRQGDAAQLPFPDGSFDVVVSFETIEHLADQTRFLEEIRRVLTRTGLLIISSPDKAVYSPSGESHNEFHVHELGRDEFAAATSRLFAHVTLFEQRALHGSVILHAGQGEAGAPVEGFDTPDGVTFHRADGVPAAPYLIALCALGAPPAAAHSVMHTPRLLWHMEEMRQREAARGDRFETQSAQAQTEVDHLRREVDHVQTALQRETREGEAYRARAGAAEARLHEVAEQLNAILNSTSWRMTGALRAGLRHSPGLARVARLAVKGAWWTVTGQLPARIRMRRAFLAAHGPGAASPAPTSLPPPPPPAAGALAPLADGLREWERREPMKEALRLAEAARLARVSPSPATLVAVRPDAVRQAIAALSFPTPDHPVVSIVVPVFNNLAMTVECLASLRKYADDRTPFEVILADDASTDATGELLSQVPGLVYVRNIQNTHYLKNCNHAARVARGDFVLFLNNDVQVTANWLAPLVDIFRRQPACAAAGPRILYASGHLQEAGVLIEPDCGAAMLGLNDDPDLARYRFDRRVDYCSGAALIFRRSVWEEIGGYDESLAPAYCEDMEICLRLHARGQEVWYVHGSTVVHHLSRTTAAENTSAKMRMIVANQQKVAVKWSRQIDALNKVEIFAFYLPQFHPIPENDQWWGPGFTEWSNVTRATPQYPGHYQPQLPSTLGFYDLRLPEIMKAQAEMARRYGVTGFCFYYYWFAGKRLLETPLERMLASGEPDFPFFLCWANENWSRRWDGQDREILIAQKHSPEDDEAIIRDLMRYMRDRRYVRIHGRPLLLVYRVDLLPDFRQTALRWRALCREEGLGEIYLAAVESFEFSRNPEALGRYGLDGSVQFPPHGDLPQAHGVRATAAADFKGLVHDYETAAKTFASQPFPAWSRFPTVMPGWDNTARRMTNATIFDGSSPGAFQSWLETAIDQTRRHNGPGERIVFVNAWNEWAEGAQLEPDRVFGHARLEAVRGAQLTRFLGK